MPYLPSIPIGSQTLKSSQPQIKANFEALNTVYGHDHFAYNEANANYIGRHKFITIPGNLTLPTPGANELAIYDKIVSGKSELFMRRDGSLTEYQLTTNGYPTTNPGSLQIKAAVRFQCATGVISYSYNVSSITNSDPNYGINFTTPLSSANYYASVTGESAANTNVFRGNGTKTASQYGVFYIANASSFVQVVIFGV